jgi:hypothetical protein
MLNTRTRRSVKHSVVKRLETNNYTLFINKSDRDANNISVIHLTFQARSPSKQYLKIQSAPQRKHITTNTDVICLMRLRK